MNRPFIDTAYLVALINPRDQLRETALRVRSQMGGRKMVISELVMVETLNYFGDYREDLKRAAQAVVERMLVNFSVEVVEQTSALFHDGMRLYGSRLDKGYSLTDCISMNICRERGITEVLTHDDHFRQEGFRILL